jgi:hypothetical protein
MRALLGDTASLGSASRVDLEARLCDHAHSDSLDPASRAALAAYFARRFHRLAERRRPLMGALHERLPQPLEDA